MPPKSVALILVHHLSVSDNLRVRVMLRLRRQCALYGITHYVQRLLSTGSEL